MHPFTNYEIALGTVEEVRAASVRRYWWRRAAREVIPPPPFWDAEVIQLMIRGSDCEQEKVGA